MDESLLDRKAVNRIFYLEKALKEKEDKWAETLNISQENF